MSKVTETGRCPEWRLDKRLQFAQSWDLSGWNKLSTASKELVNPQASANRRLSRQQGCKAAGQAERSVPLRRTSSIAGVCRGDSHGHSGPTGLDGEKVMAQTIYFIMSEGDKLLHQSTARASSSSYLPVHRSMLARDHHPSLAALRVHEPALWVGRAARAGEGLVGKWAAMGGGFIAGGLVIGLTGGLAAPLIAPALVGLTGASFLATSGGSSCSARSSAWAEVAGGLPRRTPPSRRVSFFVCRVGHRGTQGGCRHPESACDGLLQRSDPRG